MREELLQALEQDGLLPPFPDMIIRLRKMIEDPDTGMDEVARVVQSDPVLAGRLIRLANSVLGAGTSFTTNNLNRALGRLGLKMAMDLAYSLKVPSIFPNKDGFNYNEFWRYSLGLGVTATKLGEEFGLLKDELSHVYLGGLMRNIGVLLFIHLKKDSYLSMLNTIRSELKGLDTPRMLRRIAQFESKEQKEFGIDNSELGSAFIKRWWKVDPEVLEYVQFRPKVVLNQQQYLVEMARYVLWDAKVPDGLLSPVLTLPPNFLKQRFNIGEKLRQQLHSDLQVAFQVMR
jgi:HD-like signal output (HDOD) protein